MCGSLWELKLKVESYKYSVSGLLKIVTGPDVIRVLLG